MNMGVQPSSEAMQVHALIEDLKRQKQMMETSRRGFTLSPNKTQSKWASTASVFGAGPDYQSDYTDNCKSILNHHITNSAKDPNGPSDG
jgi:hypothetical protein